MRHSMIIKNNRLANNGILVFTIILTACLSIAAVCIGQYSMGINDVFNILTQGIFKAGYAVPSTMEMVVYRVRLPRIAAAILVGAGLSLSGATYQGVFRNPLVSPDLLGVSAGSCVGAAFAIITHMGSPGVRVLALVGGIIAVLLTTSIPKLIKNQSILILVLSGVIVSGFMHSVLGFIKYTADPESELASIMYWQLGSIANVKSIDVLSVFPLMFVTFVILILLRWRISILSLGDKEAAALGMEVKRTRGIVVLCSTILTACSVCISGTIGWIGLIIPHLCRLIVGPDNRRLLPLSIFAGASFMIVADTIARSISTAEIPLSIITGFVGAPLYAWLLYKQRIKIK